MLVIGTVISFREQAIAFVNVNVSTANLAKLLYIYVSVYSCSGSKLERLSK